MLPILRTLKRKILLVLVGFLFLQNAPDLTAQCTNVYRVWNDCNGDGQQGAFENGIVGVNVTLYNASCQRINTVVTGANGEFTFGTLAASTMYYAVFGESQFANGTLNIGGRSHNLTTANIGSDATDSDAMLGGTPPTCVGARPYVSFTTPASACGTGLLDAGFIALDFQVDAVNITHETCFGSNNGAVSIALSNLSGNYSTTLTGRTQMANVSSYTNLAPGNYTLEVRATNLTCNTFYRTSFTINAGIRVPAPTVTSDQICQFDVTSRRNGLSAIGVCTGGGTPTIEWYTSASGGSPVGLGTYFNPLLPPVSLSTATVGTRTYYAQMTCNGCTSLRVAATFQVLPRPAPIITGEEAPCPNATHTYTTPSVVGNTYVWSLPSGGGTILSTNANSITIRWNNTANAGPFTVRVVETNMYQCSQSRDLGAIRIKETNVRCNGNLYVSTDEYCRIELTAENLLAGAHNGSNWFKVQILDGANNIVEEGTGRMTVDGIAPNGSRYQFIGKTLRYRVTEPCGANSCWSYITFEDKKPPIITCPEDISLNCVQVQTGEAPSLTVAGRPTIIDCSETTTTFSDISREIDCRSPFTAIPSDMLVLKQGTLPNTGDIVRIVLRTFTVKDFWGATTTCRQYIFIRKGNLRHIVCPRDIDFECQNYTGDGSIAPSVLGYPLYDIDGNPNTTNDQVAVNSGACRIDGSFTDQRVDLCKGSFKIVRTWTVFDWCATDDPFTPNNDERRMICVQTIKVSDKTPPTVTAHFTQYYSLNGDLAARDTAITFDGYYDQTGVSRPGSTVNIWTIGNAAACGGRARITIRMKDDACTRDIIHISSSDTRLELVRGSLQFNATTGETVATFEGNYMELGDYETTFTATDACGYASATQKFMIRVRDNIKPQPICIELTRVTITNDGTARMMAESLNIGSRDNCAIERFEVRRMTNCYSAASTLFKPYVDFYCCDVSDTVQVVLRVYDYHGNYNDCMVWVIVDDKIKPTCIAPPNRSVLCGEVNLNVHEQFGAPTFWDNCALKDTVYTFSHNLTNCQTGSLTRKWVITDNGGKKDSCTQIITVRGKSDFTVDFPDDVEVTCFTNIQSREQARQALLTNPRTRDGHIINDGCGVIMVEVTDDTLTAVTDACYKILRKYTVIDWCKFNPNGYDSQTGCYGQPVCGDVHSNSNWFAQNSAAWFNLVRPSCTNERERRFRDADGLVANIANTNAYSDGIICFTQVIKITDRTAPVFSPCPADTVIADYSTSGCEGTIRLTANASDVCQGTTINASYLRYSWIILQGGNIAKTGTGNTLVQTLAYGIDYTVRWIVSDLCGNETRCEQRVRLEDAKKPSITCFNVNAELMRMSNGQGMAELWANDFNSSPLTDNCTPTAFLNSQLVVERVSESTGRYPTNPRQGITFTCADAGNEVSVRVWTRDRAGNADYCTARVMVQDNMNVCARTGFARLSGIVVNEMGAVVQEAMVKATMSSSVIGSSLTSSMGTYSINNLTQGNSYAIQANRDDNQLNGVSTFDIALISRHILGFEPLSSPYKIIAADVDRDGDVSAVDMLTLRRCILRILPTFPNGTPSWRFVDKRYSFIDPTNPLAEDFPEVVSLVNIPQAAQADFTAIKVGDVDITATVSALAATTISPRHDKSLIFTTEDKVLKAGEEYALTLRSDDFNALGYQFTLNHTEGVEIVKIQTGNLPDVNENSFGRFKTALTTSWNGRVADRSVEAFTLILRATKTIRLSEVLSISSTLTTAEAYNSDGETMGVKLKFTGKNTEGGEFALYQNEPNPFENQTKIAFQLPVETQGKLTIYNAAGQVLKTVEQDFAKGYNEIRLTKAELNASGVLFYRLDTHTHSATKKMIILQ